jgi:hypothetical protein
MPSSVTIIIFCFFFSNATLWKANFLISHFGSLNYS